MFPLFLGLTAANLMLLVTVFVIGLFVVDHTQTPTAAFDWHMPLGIAAGLMAAFTHVAVYMYHMATARWLEAATDKVGVPVARWVTPALARKRKVFFVMIGTIAATMVTMFSGVLADPTMNPLLPGEVHLLIGALAIAANVGAALSEARHIRRQGLLMDDALAVLNQTGGAPAAP
jgi:hypothetical protein